jgi:4-hydroxy-tetrahydrodipicolinate synthase
VNPFRGVIVASVTPFADSGLPPLPPGADYAVPCAPSSAELDASRIAPLVERAVAAGLHGFLVCGSTGEITALSGEERRRIVRAAVAAARGRIPIIACVGAATTREAWQLALDAAEAGAAGLLVQPPWYSLPSVAEISYYVWAVSDAKLPIALYNYPARTGVDLRPAAFAKALSAPHVVAVKESSGDVSRIDQWRAASDGRLDVLCGSDDLAFDFLARGCTGWISGSANLAPRLHVELFRRLVQQVDLAAARQTWKKLGALLAMLEQGGTFVQSVKAGMGMLGLAVGDPRMPLWRLERDADARLRRLLDELRAHEELA